MPGEAGPTFRFGQRVIYNDQIYFYIKGIREHNRDMAEIAEIGGREYFWIPEACYWDIEQRTLRVPADYLKPLGE